MVDGDGDGDGDGDSEDEKGIFRWWRAEDFETLRVGACRLI